MEALHHLSVPSQSWNTQSREQVDLNVEVPEFLSPHVLTPSSGGLPLYMPPTVSIMVLLKI